MLDRRTLKVVTFDCYGTLIDWEAGLLGVLRPLFAKRGLPAEEDNWLESYAILERYAEGSDGRGYRPYWQVLREVMAGLDASYKLRLSEDELGLLAESLPGWPVFADTLGVLQRLRSAGLVVGVISNVDEALFRGTCEHSGLRPDWVVTAERCRSYKPSLNNFRVAASEHGLEKASWLHVGQSLFHDIEPASELELRSVWVDRRSGRIGPGATYPGVATPTMRVESLEELAVALGV
ncbi:MAG: HAD hydrolase-like protein [Phycisphaerales bacterium]|nr:HAD hydrolase-like protein [Phycisphaerales bacterium]